MATVTDKLLTAEEFSRLPNPPDGSKQELVKGEIVTMPPPSFKHGEIQLAIGSRLKQFVRAKGLGRVTVESGLITERDPDTVRGPDISFWSFERLPPERTPQVYPEVAADLCVEILTPNSRAAEIRDKIQEYFARDIRMVWIVEPEERTVKVYRSPDEGRIFHEKATLSGEEVLPGFSCLVAELFA